MLKEIIFWKKVYLNLQLGPGYARAFFCCCFFFNEKSVYKKCKVRLPVWKKFQIFENRHIFANFLGPDVLPQIEAAKFWQNKHSCLLTI